MFGSDQIGESFFGVVCLPSRELTYHPAKSILNNFEDDFPFPKVGYMLVSI